MITADYQELASSGFKPFGNPEHALPERMTWKKGRTLIVAHHLKESRYAIGLVRKDSKFFNSHMRPCRNLPLDTQDLADIIDFAEDYRRIRQNNLKMLEREAEDYYNSFWPATAAA